MEVAEEEHLVVEVAHLEKLLRVVNCRVEQLAWIRPASVEVGADEIASVVAVDNTVRIEHWHNLEDECLAK